MIIALVGPTAAGKSALAMRLADRLQAEIVSVDSAQVYRRLDIGSAKPTTAERETIRHWLIDVRDPWEVYSAADFAHDAALAIQDIEARGRTPLLVGGTMLYLRALRDGMSSLPSADPDIRAELRHRLETFGLPFLHAELAEVDAASAARIHPNDTQRTLRALEIYRSTGVPMSAQLGRAGGGLEMRTIAVSPSDRAVLHARIEVRLRAMFDAGLIDEVRHLMDAPGMHADLPSMRSVGYRQVWSHLAGEYDRQTCFERTLFATRQLAKRQLTWLRGDPSVSWIEPDAPLDSVLAHLR